MKIKVILYHGKLFEKIHSLGIIISLKNEGIIFSKFVQHDFHTHCNLKIEREIFQITWIYFGLVLIFDPIFAARTTKYFHFKTNSVINLKEARIKSWPR